MDGLRVKGEPVDCDRLGNPLVDSFLELLLPDPAGRGDREKARKATSLDYIYDLKEFVQKVAKKIGTDQKDIWEVISFDSPVKGAKKRKRPTVRHRIVLPDEEDIDEEDIDEEDIDEEDIDEEDIQEGHLNNDNLKANCRVLSSLALLMGQTNPDTEYDYYALLKDTSLPFIEAIKQHGPVVSKPKPEKPNEVLFGVSQRAEHLGLNFAPGRVAQVGKRALQLYRRAFPGFNPPQRTVKNDHGHEYLMNQYSETTAKKSLDIALREEQNK